MTNIVEINVERLFIGVFCMILKKSFSCAQPHCQSPDSEVKVHGVQRVPGYIMSNTAQVLFAVKACQVAFWDVNARFGQHRNVFAGVLPLTLHGIDAKPQVRCFVDGIDG